MWTGQNTETSRKCLRRFGCVCGGDSNFTFVSVFASVSIVGTLPNVSISKFRCRIDIALVTLFGICPFGMSVGSSAILTEASLGFPQSLQANAATVLRLGHGRLLPYHFHFIMPASSCHSTRHYALSYWLRRHRTYDLLTNLHRGLYGPYPHFYWFLFYWSDGSSTGYPTYEPQARFNIILRRSAQIFQKCRCQLIIVGAIRVVISKFHTEAL